MEESVDNAAVVTDLETLVERSAGGDEGAFGALYDVTAARVYALAMRILGDQVQVAECVQDAYLHLWAYSPRFCREQGSAMAWILVLVHERAVSRLRSQAGSTASDEMAVSTVGGPLPGPLSALGAAQWQAVELAYFEGCTHTEVDRRAGLSAGTAHEHMRNGLLALTT